MRKGLYRSSILVTAGVGILVACSDPAVEIGTATGAVEQDPCPTDAAVPDAVSDVHVPYDANLPDAPPGIVDAGPDAQWLPDVYVPPQSEILIVDGIQCSIHTVSGSSWEWPQWSIHVGADCGPLGSVQLGINSYANIPYPQTCSVATTVSMNVASGAPDGGDAGDYSSFYANLSDGSCSIVGGPTMLVPAQPLEYSAHVVALWGFGSHDIYYRGEP